MKRKVILLSGIFVIIIILVIVFFKIYKNSNNDYAKAKKETLIFLEENIIELEKVCKDALFEKKHGGYKYNGKDYDYIKDEFSYTNIDGKEHILININAQGMLGGQYWYLIYCEDDYLNGKKYYIYDEYKERKEGNNIFIIEKIKDNWYFYYQDWDGKVDVKKIIK